MIFTQEQQIEYERRWADLADLQDHYADFRDFYADCSEELLGFTPSDMQFDISNYVANGPLYSMVQAQRGEAKTTITGCYAVWCLIHNPGMRVLIVSAGTPLAKQISTWCIQIINYMDCLECLRCDTSHPGARCSVEAYDVHWMLKGANKSASISCLGITSTSQGYRADLLIADDVESAKNSLTELMRQQLIHLTRDFSSICSDGKIIYLGTPQSTDSIYNTLTSRGFSIRIYPGRVPNAKELEYYGENLAPFITRMLIDDPNAGTGHGMLGDQGRPTDPIMMDEEKLIRKQLDQGPAYFQLQYMLNTSLMDKDRYPLKLKDLMFYSFDFLECPGKFTWSNSKEYQIKLPSQTPLPKELIFRPAKVHEEYFQYTQTIASIDPSGGGANGDETGVAILSECNGFIIVRHVTGIPGGTSPESLDFVMGILKKYLPHKVIVEKNYGNGAYAEALKGRALEQEFPVSIEEVWSTGQKELRIIDSMDPVMGSHKLLIDLSVLDHDITSTQKYSLDSRMQFQFLFQLCKITRDRSALIHDDRLEAVAQGITYLIRAISRNADKAIEEKKMKKLREFQQDPYGVWRHSYTNTRAIPRGSMGNAMARFTIPRSK